ncbi:MAG TPA: nucleotide exchange factor GrpE [Ignavibacteriaceae bacterium]|nr:nucleotide exchange factor GrpE [Ignavibacteriaceae bacterium]
MKDEHTKDKKDKVNIEKDNEIPSEDEKISDNENELSLKISQLEKDTVELKDALLRKAAEFENYKRRSENEQLNLIKYAAESFILKILTIVDDLERTLVHLEESENSKSIAEGIKLVYEKFVRILKEQGVSPIESIGKPFNVDFHEALLQRKDSTVKPHTVLDEIQKGYLYKDKVIRHAQVIVSEDSELQSAEKESDNSAENIS